MPPAHACIGTAHSVVRLESGAIYDITPRLTERPYPFLPTEESNAEYCAFVDDSGVQHLDYVLATGRVYLRSATGQVDLRSSWPESQVVRNRSIAS